ncbi:MAG: hypothetical protein M3169_11715, partial [Candidatus Eremiobacteraeota bacterium]|nr:hypothetical protein [Candidatus Eremiobacteraeota bacterium]
TQLLDRRRREELGLAPHVAPSSSSTPVRFGPESILGDDDAPQRPRAAMLRVAVDARPERELIPGAVVTVVASVHDDGDIRADDVLLRVVLPPECEPVAGSFARGDVALDSEALLGEGLRVGTIAGGDAVRVRFAVRVLPGTGPLHVSVHATAPGVPAIAAPALRLTRRAGHAAYDAPRPFFELEADEADDTLTAIAAPAPPHAVDTVLDEPAAPVVAAPEVIVVPDVVVTPEVEDVVVPGAVVTPEVVVTPDVAVSSYPPAVVIVKPAAPEPVVDDKAVVTAAAEPEPEPAKPPRPRKRAAPRPKQSAEPANPYVLARTLDDDDVRALERIFDGSVPHGLAALALLSSIAAVDTPLGDALGIRDFARAIAAAVPRALVATRMNRPPPPVVTRESLETIRAFAPVPNEPFPQYFPLLVTRLDERELGALRTVLERDLDDVFLRAVQVLLAVAPRSLEGVKSDAIMRADDALAAYRVAAGAWLMRVTVRRAVDRGYDPLTAADASLHEAGRKLVTALRGAFG